MKRIFIALILVLVVCTQAWATRRIAVTKNDAGTMSHVTAFVTETGQTVFLVDDSGGVTIFYSNLIPISGASTFVIGESVAGYYAIYNSTSSVTGTETIDGSKIGSGITNASLPDPITSGVSTDQLVSGGIYTVNLTSSETLSGKTMYGAIVGNYGANSEVTATLPALEEGMNVGFRLRKSSELAASGATIIILIDPTDTVIGIENFSSSASAIMLSGTTLGSECFLNYAASQTWEFSGVTTSTREQ